MPLQLRQHSCSCLILSQHEPKPRLHQYGELPDITTAVRCQGHNHGCKQVGGSIHFKKFFWGTCLIYFRHTPCSRSNARAKSALKTLVAFNICEEREVGSQKAPLPTFRDRTDSVAHYW